MQTCARVTQEKRAGRCHKRAGKSRRPSARRAHLIAAVKEKDKLDIRFAIHDCVPTLKVVLITGEAIYEEAKLLFIFLHGLFHRLQGGNGKRKRDRLGDGKTQDKRQTNCFNAKSIRFVTGTSKLRQKGAQIWFFAPPPFLFCASKRLVVSTRTPLPPCGSKASLHNNKTEEEHWAENGLVVHVRCKCCSCSNGGSGCHHQLRMTAGRGVHGRLFFFQFNSTLDIAAI